MASLARYFKQEVLDNVRADVDLVVRRVAGPEDDAPPPNKRARKEAAPGGVPGDPLQLTKFPAHNIVLNASEYLKVQQGEHWQAVAQLPASTRTRRGSSSNTEQAQRPTVQLTIANAEQLPAAEAVVAAMYGVPDAISSLEQHDAVHAIVIADMVHAEAAGQQALQVLQAAAQSGQGLTAVTLQALADLPEWPSCLLELLPTIAKHAPCCRDRLANLAAVAAADAGGKVQRLLVAALGDLQAVWSDAQQQALLLALPLPAMLLLLSSDELRVPSEDIVLFTARQYVKAQARGVTKLVAKAVLAQLVRAPQLSMFALSCAALPADSSQQLLGSYTQKLRDLLSLKRVASGSALAAALQTFEVPAASWLLGPRLITPLGNGVRLEWRLPVERLKQACRDSFAQQKDVSVHSTGVVILGGLAWRMTVVCEQAGGGSRVGLYLGPAGAEMPAGMYYRVKYTVSWPGAQKTISSQAIAWRSMRGNSNIFKLQPMAGDGWDDAVWAAAGLPTSGEMLLELCMHSVE